MADEELQFDDLSPLLAALCDGTIDRESFSRLESALAANPAARRWYISYLDMHGELHWNHLADGRRAPDDRRREPCVSTLDEPGDIPTPDLDTPVPPIIVTPSHPSFLARFPSLGSWAFSYTVATLIVGLFLLGAWAYKITHHNQFADNSRRSSAPEESAQDRPEMIFVGRITGMAGVKWSADPRYLPPIGFAHVPLGRKYKLDAGLMQITYDSGAKVILQGPCTYEVDSSVGGYLALGKLTARVETRGSGIRGQGSEKANHQITSPQSPIPNPFVVTTPTAVVTDLGTEFGVEVDEDGATTSHVFRGSVQVKILPSPASGRGAEGEGDVLQLAAGETALVKKGEADAVRFTHPTKTPKFVRRLYEPPKLLDLLDIVAGGNGTGNRRERGIDPTSGRYETRLEADYRGGSRQYQTIFWHRLIDGAFVPDGRAGAVQLNSAGHVFDGFPATTCGTWGPVWARTAEVKPEERVQGWIFALGPDKQFMPQRRGVLGCHANSGLTFDLRAIREMYPNVRPGRFRAVAGLADARVRRSWMSECGDGMADLWIFVDGRQVFNRMKLRPADGTLNLDVKLAPGDRFLTLAVTDGGNGMNVDWFVFGDPVLTMVSTESENVSH